MYIEDDTINDFIYAEGMVRYVTTKHNARGKHT